MVANFISSLSNIGSLGLNFASGTSVSKTNKINDHINALWRSNYQWANENGYSYMRKGLEAADYNPLLAIGASPQQGFAPSAVASGDSFGFNMDTASGKQANVARDMAGSQIQLNRANANKINEEAITQQNLRANYDADTNLKRLQAIVENTMLPYRVRSLAAETQLKIVQAQLAPYNAESGRISANAQNTTAEFNKEWTPKQLGYTLGAGLLGLTPFGVGKLKSMFKRPVGFH